MWLQRQRETLPHASGDFHSSPMLRYVVSISVRCSSRPSNGHPHRPHCRDLRQRETLPGLFQLITSTCPSQPWASSGQGHTGRERAASVPVARAARRVWTGLLLCRAVGCGSPAIVDKRRVEAWRKASAQPPNQCTNQHTWLGGCAWASAASAARREEAQLETP